jgi:hypothetical protein
MECLCAYQKFPLGCLHCGVLLFQIHAGLVKGKNGFWYMVAELISLKKSSWADFPKNELLN